ncbi:MAG: hypothetical protein F4X94_03785 [Dehalococcoidia bacterium]|nr:hypothetical protein [Dehalococcoidia bacterium]
MLIPIAVLSEITTYVHDANQSLEDAEDRVSQFPTQRGIATDILRDISERAEGFLDAVGRLPMPLTREPLVEQVVSELTRTREDISNFKTATEALDEDKRKRLASLDSRFNGIDKKAVSIERRVDRIVGDQQTAFGRSESERSRSFESQLRRQNAEFGSMVEGLNRDSGEILGELRTNAEGILVEMKGHLDRTEKILGVTATENVAGAWMKEATRQAWVANILRAVAAIFAIAAVVIIVWFFQDFENAESSLANNVTFNVTRISVLLLLSGTAFLLFGQSNHHRDRERDARSIENQLKTFRPFIGELDEPIQHRLIQQASLRFFPGLGPERHDVDGDGSSTKTE